MTENQDNIMIKDFDYYLNCSKEELGKIYRDNAIKEERLKEKLKVIKNEIDEAIKNNDIVARAMIAKSKQDKHNKERISFKKSKAFKSAMDFEKHATKEELEKINNELQNEIHRGYDD